MLHSLEQDWITSSLGTNVDQSTNSLWQDFGGNGLLIGNGAPDVASGATPAERYTASNRSKNSR